MITFTFSDRPIHKDPIAPQNSDLIDNLLCTGNHGYGHPLLELPIKFERFFDEWRKDQHPCNQVGITACQMLTGLIAYPVGSLFIVIGLGTNALHLRMSNGRAKSAIQELLSKELEIGAKELVPNKPDSTLSRKFTHPFSASSSVLSNEELRRCILPHVIKKIDESTSSGIFLTGVVVTYDEYKHNYATTCTRTLSVKLTFNLPNSIKD